jgi:hypothetical protein
MIQAPIRPNAPDGIYNDLVTRWRIDPRRPDPAQA